MMTVLSPARIRRMTSPTSRREWGAGPGVGSPGGRGRGRGAWGRGAGPRGAEVGEGGGGLKLAADPLAQLLDPSGDGQAKNANRAGIGFAEAFDDLEGGRLAGAVRAEAAEGLAG